MYLRRFLFMVLILSLLGAIWPAAANTASDITNKPIPELTLKEAILLSLRYNPDIRNAELKRIVDKFSLRLAQNAFEVQYALTGSANYQNSVMSGNRAESESYNIQPQASLLTAPGTKFTVNGANPIINTASGGGSFYNPSLSFNVTQPLLQGFGPTIVLTPLHNAQDQELVNQLILKAQMITTVTAVISQYVAVVQNKQAIKTQQISIEGSKATLKQQQALVKAGRSAPADLVQFQSTIANQQATMQETLIKFQSSEYALLTLLGLNPNTAFSVPDDVTMNDKMPTLVESIKTALANNTDYQKALINLRVLKRNLVVAKDQQRWQLNLTATRTQGGGSGGAPNSGPNSLFNGQNLGTSVGLNLTIPINNLSLEQQLISARVALEQAEISLDGTERTVESNVQNAYNALVIQKQKLVLDQEAVKLAVQTLDIAQTKLKYDRVTPFEVSTLQTTLTTTQLSYINDQQAYISLLAAFEQVLGTTLDRWNIQVRY